MVLPSPTSPSKSAMKSSIAEVMASFFLGGFLLAIVITPIAYFAVKRMVVRSRAWRAKRKARMLENGGGE